MCGFVGLWRGAEGQHFPSEINRAAMEALRHRGPDDQGMARVRLGQGNLLLGHRRLAVIDTSCAGHQPMASPSGRYLLAYNGEIYNFVEIRKRLISEGFTAVGMGDTAVLVAAWEAWGTKAIGAINGMFSFAVVDRHRHTLTLARDAFGIKPLYFAHVGGSLAFGSQIDALELALGRSIAVDQQNVFDYLAYGIYDREGSSALEGVQHLQPGTFVQYSFDSKFSRQECRWWSPSIDQVSDLSRERAALDLRALISTNVRQHLRSDVPVAVALSGGIDSSSIVGMMRHLDPSAEIHTFSFISPGSASDEERWIDLMNRYVGAQSHKITVDESHLARDLDDLIRSQGEPFGSTSVYAQYRVFRAAREAGFVVMIDGQGADELLGGYNGYAHARIRSLLERGDVLGALRFANRWREWPGRSLGEAANQFLGGSIPQSWYALGLSARVRSRAPSWIDHRRARAAGIDLKNAFESRDYGYRGRRLAAALRHSVTNYGLASLLRHGDRNSMRWSVESRVPFLTRDLADFALSLPEKYLVSEMGETKHLLRQAMAGLVPPEILHRRDKIGFVAPSGQWLRPFGRCLDELIDGVRDLPFVDAKAAQADLRAVIDGRRTARDAHWRLVNLSRWSQLRSSSGGFVQ